MSAIILDGHLKSALCSVRSLGKWGIKIACGAERTTAMACHSKYVTERFVYTSPERNKEAFVQEVIAKAKELFEKQGEKQVLYCFSDATLLALVFVHESLQEWAVLAIPPVSSVEIAADKLQTHQLAERLSIPVIATYTEDEFKSISYPVVVKNRHSVVWKENKGILGSASFVFSEDELISAYRKITTNTGEEPLVQKFVKGSEFGIEMVCAHGTPIATFAHKRIRSLSPRGGAAVVKETASGEEEVKLMRRYAETLVKELSWHGPVMVEFKIDEATGHVHLMEINGRFWGSLPLAVRAGVDFPLTYYKLATGDAVEKMTEVSLLPYMRTRHFLGDVKWVCSVLFSRDRMRKELFPTRLRAFYDFKKELFLSKGDIFAWDDIKPSFMEYIDILTK